MIQRLQSLYLMFIIIGSICMFLFPIANYVDYQAYVYGLKQVSATPLINLSSVTFPVYIRIITMILCILAIGILSLVNIFLYNNRKRQMNLIKIILLLNVLLIVIIFFYADLLEKTLSNTSQYSVSTFIPLFTIILAFMAGRGIKKDDNLVKSADRLR